MVHEVVHDVFHEVFHEVFLRFIMRSKRVDLWRLKKPGYIFEKGRKFLKKNLNRNKKSYPVKLKLHTKVLHSEEEGDFFRFIFFSGL